MTLDTLLASLHEKGIQLWVEDGTLRYRAPKGALTPAMRSELQQHKPALLTLLQANPAAQAPAGGAAATQEQYAPLSATQQRIWFIERIQPGSAVYTIHAAVRLTRALDASLLEQSVNFVVQRHAILRTSVQQQHGQPVQRIAPVLRVPLEQHDLRHMPASARARAIHQRLLHTVQQPFNLSVLPLLRVLFLRETEQQAVLALTTHHLIADGWSVQLFLHELVACYQALAQQHPPALPALPLQFADYVRWEQTWRQSSAAAAQLTYWKQQLAAMPDVLALPTDYPRPTQQAFRGAVYSFLLPPELATASQTFSRQARVTLFMLLLAAFQALLARYTQQPDIPVATAISHRPRREFEGLIGPFSNNLILRSHIVLTHSFRVIVQQVREVVSGAFANQDIAFDRLVEELSPRRDPSYNPLFQVMFLLQNALPSSVALHNTPATDAVEPLPEIDPGITRFDLVLLMTETPQGLAGRFEYNTDLFKAATIERMAGHLQTLLASVLAHPDQPIATLPLLTAAEHQQLFTAGQAPRNVLPANLSIEQCIADRAAHRAAAPALVLNDDVVTYGDMERRANQLAHWLRDQGVGADVLVGLWFEREPDLVVAMLAVLKAGGAYLPLDPAYPTARLHLMLVDSGVGILLSRAALCPQVPTTVAQVVSLDTPDMAQVLAQQPTHAPPPQTTGDHLAYVIYTSGSTGTPRGVMLTRRGLLNLAQAQAASFALHEGSRVLQFAALSFDAVVSEIFTTLLAGGTLDLGTSSMVRAGAKLAHLLRERQITAITLPPSVLASLPVLPLPALATLVVAGEACAPQVAQQWAVGRRCINAYGPTETTVCATLGVITSDSPAPEQPLRQPLSIGTPLANLQAYVLDAAMQPVPINVPGELYVGGAGLARGYVKHPARTAAHFVPHPFSTEPGERLYRTGDLVCWREDGTLAFLGRRDQQIKLRGHRIELGDVAAALRAHTAVQDAAVIVREERSGDQRLLAYVVPRQAQGAVPQRAFLDPHALRHDLQTRLPAYMVPSAVVLLDTLPLTPTGKVDRRALAALEPQPALPVPPGDRLTHDSADDALVYELAAIWREVLGVPHVRPQDSFFALGGHSLLLVQMVERVQQHFGQQLPLMALLHGGTVAEMAALLRQPDTAKCASPLVPIQSAGDRPPLFFVHPLVGVVFPYYDLATQLGKVQPFYGLQSVGFDPAQEPHLSVEEMAAAYIRAIQTVQPTGPYNLGGWSLGSLVAFEMAQQLQRAGQPVGSLIVLDTSAPSAVQGNISPIAAVAFFLTMMPRFIWPYVADYGYLLTQDNRAAPLPVPGLLRVLLRRARMASVLRDNARPILTRQPLLKRMWYMMGVNIRVAAAYRAQAYPHSLTLLHTGHPSADPTLGWGGLAAGGVDVRLMSGNHFSLLRQPHVQRVAREIRGILDGSNTP